MKVLTKELKNDLDLHEIYCALVSKDTRTMPVVFLNGVCEGVEETDVKTVKTKFGMSDRDNEISFMMLPTTFAFFDDYCDDEDEDEMCSPENDFLSQYVNRLRIVSYLPEDILKQVKDKRLLAMGYAEKNVKSEIIKYAKAKKTAALKKLHKSLKNSLEAVSGLTIENQFAKSSYIESISELFEEAVITGVSKKDNDVHLKLNGANVVILTGAKTIEEEINPENTRIRLYELHKSAHGYELHLLLAAKDENLIENFYYLTYVFKDMLLK